MTQQVTDPFVWRGEEYTFSGADNVYSLFDPEAFGLHPEAPTTACWKGFVIFFSVRDDQLFIDQLDVFCLDESYPVINGIEAKEGGIMGMRRYENLSMPSDYTGKIVISKTMKERYRDRAFTGPHSYEENFDLDFENGKLISYRETKGEYHGF